MTIQRKLDRIATPAGAPGFLGAGHIARQVVGSDFSKSDPFIFLMDDFLDKKDDSPVGGAHPHAGFETVTLLLAGEVGGPGHRMKTGDFQLMTAGSGVVHTETIEKAEAFRLLQLWLTLPRQERWAPPRLQDLPLAHAPYLERDGLALRLYSGTLAGLTSPVLNHTPLIVAEISLEAGAATTLELPANYNTFLYVLEGDVRVSEEERLLRQDQVGWLSLTADDAPSSLQLAADKGATRFVLYAGKPQGVPIVAHGPFIGDTPEDITRLYQEYRLGNMGHISEVPAEQRRLL